MLENWVAWRISSVWSPYIQTRRLDSQTIDILTQKHTKKREKSIVRVGLSPFLWRFKLAGGGETIAHSTSKRDIDDRQELVEKNIFKKKKTARKKQLFHPCFKAAKGSCSFRHLTHYQLATFSFAFALAFAYSLLVAWLHLFSLQLWPSHSYFQVFLLLLFSSISPWFISPVTSSFTLTHDEILCT